MKRCSTRDGIRLALVSLLISAPPLALASVETPSAPRLRSELLSRPSQGSFGSLFSGWEKRFGSNAAEPLLKIAGDRSLREEDRYVALMGAARLGGTGVATGILPFLKDRSWMMRTGAMVALGALKPEGAAAAIRPLLQDPALVVRNQARRTLDSLSARPDAKR